MFRFTRKPSSGSHSQCLTKITHLVKSGYVELLQDVVSVWLHFVTCEACVLCTVVRVYSIKCTVHCCEGILYTVYPHTVHSTHASQVTICSHNTDNVLYELYVSTLNQVCNF